VQELDGAVAIFIQLKIMLPQLLPKLEVQMSLLGRARLLKSIGNAPSELWTGEIVTLLFILYQ